MYGLPGRASDPNVAALASALLERLAQFAAEVTERICQQVEAYQQEQPVPRDDLNGSCRQNLEFGFRSLVDAGPYDLSAPRRTGRLRAAQGAPLAMVLSAYRTGFAYMWDCVVTEADRGNGSAWRLLPDLHVGIVSLRTADTLQPMVDMVRPVVATRVGVSPVYEGLEKTAQAMHLARIAMASIAPGDPQLCVFDDAPVPALIASAPTTSYRVMNNVLGPLLDTAAEERDLLLETLETYFTAGSIAEAAKRLFCHRNTVRHRLRRIEQLTGRSVDDPSGAVELYIAIQTMLRLPKPPTRRELPGPQMAAPHRYDGNVLDA